MKTYEKNLKELNITDEEFANLISHIYDKTDKEMLAIAKAIRSGAQVLPTVKRAFERVLDMRYAERKEVYNYYYSNLNTMCLDCWERMNGTCAGIKNKIYSGCVYKTVQ